MLDFSARLQHGNRLSRSCTTHLSCDVHRPARTPRMLLVHPLLSFHCIMENAKMAPHHMSTTLASTASGARCACIKTTLRDVPPRTTLIRTHKAKLLSTSVMEFTSLWCGAP